jgi:hypothetical protein
MRRISRTLWICSRIRDASRWVQRRQALWRSPDNRFSTMDPQKVAEAWFASHRVSLACKCSRPFESGAHCMMMVRNAFLGFLLECGGDLQTTAVSSRRA